MTEQVTINQTAPQPLIKYGWLRAVLYLICVLVIAALFNFAAIILLALFSGVELSTLSTNARDLIRDLGLPANIFMLALNLAATLITTWIFRRHIDRQSFISLGLRISNYKKDLLFGLVLGFVMIGSGFMVLYASGNLSIIQIRPDWLLLGGYVLFFTFGSLNEEIMIRGYFLTNLTASMNKYIALLASSLVFALLHLANANISLLSFLNILLAGLLLGIYYIHRRNLWLPIGLHFSWNFFQGPVFGYEVSGVQIRGMIEQNLSGSDLITGGPFGFEGSLIATIFMILAILLLHARFRTSG